MFTRDKEYPKFHFVRKQRAVQQLNVSGHVIGFNPQLLYILFYPLYQGKG